MYGLKLADKNIEKLMVEMMRLKKVKDNRLNRRGVLSEVLYTVV